jgi:hypothetical protein
LDITGFEMLAGSGTPISGATVELRVATNTHPNTSGVLQSTTTDANGMWTFTGLSPGSYDVKVLYNTLVKWYKGNSKVQVAGIAESGRGLNHLIDRRVLGASAATIDFVQIPTDYVDLEILLDGRGSDAAASQNLRLQLSTDTTSTPTPDTGGNYDFQQHFASAATSAAAESFGQTSGAGGLIPTAGAGANLSAGFQILLLNAMGTTFNKGYISVSRTKYGVATGNMFSQTIAGNWRNSGQIRQIRLFLSAGNFIAGTVCELWGRAAA